MKVIKSLLFRLIIPAFGFGIFAYLASFIFIKPEGWHDPHVLELMRALGYSFAIVGGIYWFLFSRMFLKSQETYDILNIWKRQVEESYNIEELENLKTILISYRHSMKCFSIQHMRYASDIILIAKTKIEMLKRI